MKIMFVSLGCDKNLVDTENMITLLENEGYEFTEDENEAEVIVVNTCCFIGDAKEESVNTLLEMGAYKDTGKLKCLIAAGCLAQRYKDELLTEIPEIDAIIGIASTDSIVSAVKDCLAGKTGNRYLAPLDTKPTIIRDRLVTTGGHFAYIKIAEGCDKRCTYCAIPYIRGPYRSVPMEDIVAQAEALADKGVREIILVAQETTIYGKDLYGRKMLPELLERLEKIPGIYWIRLLYCYPEEITDELIDKIAQSDKICHYLDIPIQHSSDNVLKKMGRRATEEGLRELIARLRQRIPDICIRTTLISGFPGETQEDFESLYRFVNEMEFDRLGVFTYSCEENTPAASFPDQIEGKVSEFRRNELMELQQEIAFENGENKIGCELLVIIEGKVADEDTYVGRTYMDAPGVDGYIFVETTANLMSGDFVKVKVTDYHDYDLIGEIVHE